MYTQSLKQDAFVVFPVWWFGGGLSGAAALDRVSLSLAHALPSPSVIVIDNKTGKSDTLCILSLL